MKFNAVVGNPPYQKQGGSGGSNDSPLYQYFAEIANRVTDGYVCLIIKAAWFTSGRDADLKAFRTNMLTSKKIKELYVFDDARHIFNSVEIKGGVCYYLFDSNYEGPCNCHVKYESGRVEDTTRNLNDLELFIRDKNLYDIVKKVVEKNTSNEWMETLVSGDTPFGIPSNPEKSKKKSFALYDTSTNDHNIKVYYNEGNTRMPPKYICEAEITKNNEDIPKDKVYIPENGGSGNDNDKQILGKPIRGEKNSVCSQTYLYIPFGSKNEAENCIKYIKTKFFRALVASIKITPSAPSRFYKFVPQQDFTKNDPIDWSTDIQKIDEQLFAIYDLNGYKEYIESRIDYME